MELETIILESHNPIKLFDSWYEQAKSLKENVQPERMTLATFGKNGGPAARTVLLRGVSNGGYKMYWNKHSMKSMELELNNKASLVFVWSYRTSDGQIGARQVRIEGSIEDLPQADIEAYFESEPVMAKIRAIVQVQSRAITDDEREEIRGRCDDLWKQVQHDGFQLQCPPGYGGFLLRPNMMEFYQGLRDTINDRIRFRKADSEVPSSKATLLGEDGWVYERLEC